MTASTVRPSPSHEIVLPCGQRLPNRMIKAALSEALADRYNRPTEQLTRLYRRWARGGFGLVITGNVMIDRNHLGEPGNVVVDSDTEVGLLRDWVSAFETSETKFWIQLNHPGRQSSPLGGARPVAPSAIAAAIPGAARPRELTHAEIETIVDCFATSAALAQSAGFHGVQLHAAHGYLISQFLSPLANVRDDQWGGDAERRRRFLLEIVRAVRARVGPSFAVGVKLNPADFQRGGFTEEESQAVVEMLAAERIDLIEISGGSYESPAMMGSARASTRAREAYFLEYARTVAHVAADIPVAVTGGFRSVEAMTAAIADRDCDLVGLGRPVALTPDAASAVLDRRITRLASGGVTIPWLGRSARTRPLRNLIDLQWYTDQLHLMGGGKDPDPSRRWWQTVYSTLLRNGLDIVRPKRS